MFALRMLQAAPREILRHRTNASGMCLLEVLPLSMTIENTMPSVGSVQSGLKRKLTEMLAAPAPASSREVMPVAIKRPMVVRSSDQLIYSRRAEHAELTYGSKAVIGTRPYMEDTFVAEALAMQNPSGEPTAPLQFFAVYDGHGGDSVSKHCAETLHKRLVKQLEVAHEQQPHDEACSTTCVMERALRAAFLQTDEHLKQGPSSAALLVGSTAVVTVLDKENLWVANCGDSRAVLCTMATGQNGQEVQVVQLTDDHKPERTDEKARIESAGGRVVFRGGFRVMGALSMSRAIGDHLLQQFGVIAEPEISQRQRQSGDEFILMASDGLWCVLTNEEAVKLARYSLQRAEAKGLSRTAAAKITASVLTEIAIQKGSQDNVTAIVIDLRPAPTAEPMKPTGPKSPCVGSPVIASVTLPPMELPQPTDRNKVVPEPQQQGLPATPMPVVQDASAMTIKSQPTFTVASGSTVLHNLNMGKIQVKHASGGTFVFTFTPTATAALVHG